MVPTVVRGPEAEGSAFCPRADPAFVDGPALGGGPAIPWRAVRERTASCAAGRGRDATSARCNRLLAGGRRKSTCAFAGRLRTGGRPHPSAPACRPQARPSARLGPQRGRRAGRAGTNGMDGGGRRRQEPITPILSAPAQRNGRVSRKKPVRFFYANHRTCQGNLRVQPKRVSVLPLRDGKIGPPQGRPQSYRRDGCETYYPSARGMHGFPIPKEIPGQAGRFSSGS